MTNRKSSQDEAAERGPRKAYTAPRITVAGTVASLTRTGGITRPEGKSGKQKLN